MTIDKKLYGRRMAVESKVVTSAQSFTQAGFYDVDRRRHRVGSLFIVQFFNQYPALGTAATRLSNSWGERADGRSN